MSTVLEVKNVEKYYGNKSNLTKALKNISFNVEAGEEDVEIDNLESYNIK